MDEQALAEVIAAARGGNPEAFDRLVDAYARRLHGYLFRLIGSRDDADDLLQEVFLRVVRTLDNYHHDGRFTAWLFRIATNAARDRLRQLRRAPGTTSLDWAPDDTAAPEPADASAIDPGVALRRQETADHLQRALARLPDGEREVIMLRHFSDLSFAEIAALMGTPLGTALARCHRGLKKLRAMLDAAPDAATI